MSVVHAATWDHVGVTDGVHDATRGHDDVWGSCYHLEPCWCLWSILVPEDICMFITWAAAWGHVDIFLCSMLPLKAILMSEIYVTKEGHVGICSLWCCLRSCWSAWSVLLLKVHATARGHVDVYGTSCCQEPYRCAWSVLLPEPILMSMVSAAAEDQTGTHGTWSCWRPCLCLWSILLLKSM